MSAARSVPPAGGALFPPTRRCLVGLPSKPGHPSVCWLLWPSPALQVNWTGEDAGVWEERLAKGGPGLVLNVLKKHLPQVAPPLPLPANARQTLQSKGTR